ncbi:outer membrane colicin Js receptor [Bibersteinia trehalosi USDA-ARS-USMARC-190]|uniref:Outer membrane colicin Js receptor n=1 Tax=Bibersteinia trehalosi USDA-ARS-USMARC-190 TaxID=1263832 RepID=W0R4D2_BIBTR|nr:TonB-dependent receptor [Bibersteinia trehalosi]AHG85621.1 outer membrane colicin Js receptor [Bibersteinia trehalosi USDA-ARS-USMARC-190]
MKKTVLAVWVASCISYAFADVATLDEVKVIGSNVFKTGSVTTRGEDKKLQSLDSIVRALPGTFTNIDPAQGTINVNIRGMSGLGRVNTTIDGVPQTFFGTSANGDRRFHDEHGGLPPSSQFGAMIEPNFLSSISVHKGFAKGEKSINALSGVAEFKTLGVDDIVFNENKVGVRSKFSYGSNALGYNAMLALAGKTEAFTQGSVGGLFAYNKRASGSNYKRGDGTYASDNNYVKRMNQHPNSWLAKFELKPSASHELVLDARKYETNIGGRTLTNNHQGLTYRYMPNSDLINLELLLAKTDNKQNYDNDSALWELTDASTTNQSRYINLKNSSYFKVAESDLTLNYGAGYFTNRYARKATGKNQDNLEYTPFAPSGRQQILSSFLSFDWKKSIYNLEGGVNYTRSTFTGFKPECGSVGEYTIPCFPQGAYNIKMMHYALDPSVQLLVELSDWFSPFVSTTRSTRMPNIQEVFFNNENGGSMNPFLKPEKAKTYQVGFNTFKNDLFTNGDYLGIKLLYYRSMIRNYITSESFYISTKGNLTTDKDDIGSGSFHAQMSINSLEPVRTSGAELELHYNSPRYFARLTYSYQKTSQPLGVQSSMDGFGFGDIYELPKHYGTLDIGTRWFDNHLTLGSIIKYTGKAKRLSPKGIDATTGKRHEVEVLPTNPAIVDLYAIYEFNKHFMLKASIQNLLNALYIDPLNSQNTTRSQHSNDDSTKFTNYARGRTYVVGGEIRF